VNGREPFAGIRVRPIEPEDAVRLERLFYRLSPETIYRRFFTLLPAPRPGMLQHLATVDHDDREALVALEGDEIIAVARWDRSAHHSADAEMAVTVEDAWQHRGLGRALTRMLAAEATRHGVTELTAVVLTDSRPALGLASGQRPDTVQMDGPETHFHFPLSA
jgi:GNAT superfamily N-acetyltransferase